MNNHESSKYTQYLPRIFQKGNNEDGDFLGRLLKSFEQILSGARGTMPPPATAM